MAPRANWKGFLRLSLVTCPIALFPATSESEKISFNQINKKTGHRIRYLKVDAETGEEVPNEDIKGYQIDKGQYLEVTKDELDNIALESTRTIEIDELPACRISSLKHFAFCPLLNRHPRTRRRVRDPRVRRGLVRRLAWNPYLRAPGPSLSTARSKSDPMQLRMQLIFIADRKQPLRLAEAELFGRPDHYLVAAN